MDRKDEDQARKYALNKDVSNNFRDVKLITMPGNTDFKIPFEVNMYLVIKDQIKIDLKPEWNAEIVLNPSKGIPNFGFILVGKEIGNKRDAWRYAKQVLDIIIEDQLAVDSLVINKPVKTSGGVTIVKGFEPEDLMAIKNKFKKSKMYSCFISYSELDSEFSEKIHSDLQNHTIDCWRWREDAKMGNPLLKEIHEAIWKKDKVIVILSQNSLKSQPVIREIERALQKEDELRKRNLKDEVLFPLRLDDSIFTWDHYRKPDIVVKNIGDFRQWRNENQYKKEFHQLLSAFTRSNME